MEMPPSEFSEEYQEGRELPRLVWLVMISTLVADSADISILGYQLSAFGWLVPLGAAVYVLLRTPGEIHFPFLIWLPWIGLVLVYLLVASAPNALQRSVMLLVPIIVGMAVSKYAVTDEGLDEFDNLCGHFWKALWVIVLFKSGIALTGLLPEVTGLAAEAMTATLLAVVFATRYAMGRKSALLWWAAMVAIPVIAVTRTAIVVTAFSLPFALGPLGARKRVMILAVICILGTGLFYTERIQNKMFHSGEGSFADISRSNPDFRTTGRTTILDAMEWEIEHSPSPWWGFGANASETFVSELTDGLTHPHNDWLRIAYDYGYFGVWVFAFCIVLQALHALRRALAANGERRFLFYAGAFSFVSFVLMMFTDNIMLYAAYFGNFQFTILGLAYGRQPPNANLSWEPLESRVS